MKKRVEQRREGKRQEKRESGEIDTEKDHRIKSEIDLLTKLIS